MLTAICTLPTTVKDTDNKIRQIESSYLYRTSSPYNIYLLSAIMEQAGHDIVIKDWISHDFDIDVAIDELLEFDVVMISCPSWTWTPVTYLINHLRSNRNDQVIILGGIHATLFHEDIMNDFPIDYIIVGEGERAVVPLLKAIENKTSPSDIPGLAYRENGTIHKNPPLPLLTGEEMGRLPLPSYERLPPGACKWLAIESSRGCVNSCTFCSEPYKKSWRPLTAESFVDRMEALIPYLPRVSSGEFLILDDSFIINVKRARDIARLIKERNLDIKAVWNGHIKELFEKDMLSDLAPYTNGILLGTESFDQETLRKIGKKFSPEDITAGAEVAKDLGLSDKLIFSFIIGFPWQNKKMIFSEVDKIFDLVSSTGGIAIINWLLLTPGSQMWKEYHNKETIAFNNYENHWREWHRELHPEDMNEIVMYISYLQAMLPKGSYQIQAPSIHYKHICWL